MATKVVLRIAGGKEPPVSVQCHFGEMMSALLTGLDLKVRTIRGAVALSAVQQDKHAVEWHEALLGEVEQIYDDLLMAVAYDNSSLFDDDAVDPDVPARPAA